MNAKLMNAKLQGLKKTCVMLIAKRDEMSPADVDMYLRAIITELEKMDREQ